MKELQGRKRMLRLHMNKKIPPSLHILGIYLRICFLFNGRVYVCVCARLRHQTHQDVVKDG